MCARSISRASRIFLRAAILAFGLGVVGGLGFPLAAQDQTAVQEEIQSEILTVDTDFIFANSLYGVQIEQEFSAAAKVLITENGEIEARLTAEEKALTQERASLSLEDFRARAQAFDTHVQTLRDAQQVKETEVQAIRTTGRKAFQEVITPILAQIARDRGASVMFERQQVFLSAESIDITLIALDRVNAAFKKNQAKDDPDAPQVTQPASENTSDETPSEVPNEAPTNANPPAVEAPASGTQE